MIIRHPKLTEYWSGTEWTNWREDAVVYETEADAMTIINRRFNKGVREGMSQSGYYVPIYRHRPFLVEDKQEITPGGNKRDIRA